MEVIPIHLIVGERKLQRLSLPYVRTSFILLAIAISFLLDSYLLERKRDVQVEKLSLIVKMTGEKFNRQKTPFPAYLSQSKEKRIYVLDSDDYAPRIRGFAGPINLLIGVDAKGEIQEIRASPHRETPSYVLGMDNFLSKFKSLRLGQKFFLTTKRDSHQQIPQTGAFGGNIDAMSGATITSQALIDIVNETGSKLREIEAFGLSKESLEQKDVASLAIDVPSLVLIFFTVSAIVLYLFFSDKVMLRRVYLFLSVIFLGFFYNSTFSVFHLSKLFTFNLPSFTLLSIILIYLIPLTLAILFGPVWCGWICPFGALQELLGSSRLSFKVSKKLDKKARYFKFAFLAFFIVVISLEREASFFKQEPLSMFFLNPTRISFDKLLCIVIIILSIFFLRFWCRYFCICRALLSFFNKISPLKRLFSKNYKNYPFGIEGPHDLDCIHCNLCLYAIRKDMRKDSYFKIAFFFTILLMIIIFFSNIKIQKPTSYRTEAGERILFERIDKERIERLIEEDKLSNKEAMFYEVIEE